MKLGGTLIANTALISAT